MIDYVDQKELEVLNNLLKTSRQIGRTLLYQNVVELEQTRLRLVFTGTHQQQYTLTAAYFTINLQLVTMDNLNRTLLNKSQGTGTQMADSTTQTVGPNVVNLTPTDSTISLLNEPVTQPGDCKSSEVISTTNPLFSDTSSLYCPSINHSLTEEPIILSNELLFSQFSVEALIEELDFTHDFGNRKVVYFGTRPYAYNGGVHEPKELEAHTYLAKVR
ncbi:hypothetical protein ACHWQZ_G003949 [Mnemiopsis leidyi]